MGRRIAEGGIGIAAGIVADGPGGARGRGLWDRLVGRSGMDRPAVGSLPTRQMCYCVPLPLMARLRGVLFRDISAWRPSFLEAGCVRVRKFRALRPGRGRLSPKRCCGRRLCVISSEASGRGRGRDRTQQVAGFDMPPV